MQQSVIKKYIQVDALIYLLILALVLIVRYLVLINFAFKYTDSDQSIMWLGLKDYSKGIFHEPRFYGQAYNSMLEALFTVPLYKLGLAAYKALPIVTSILTLLPYIIISLFAFLKKNTKISFVILSIPLLLPIEYSLITSLSRGFVTGICISAIGCIATFYPRSKFSFLFCGLIAILAYTINSNSVLLSFPCLLFLFLENIKNKYFYLFSSIGIIVGLIIHFWINYFYLLHPYYNLHQMQLDFSPGTLIASLTELDIYFNNTIPIFWGTGFLVLPLFLIIAFLLYRKKEYTKAITVALIPITIILSLGIGKVHDGTDSIFFSYSRMYLSIPILLGFSLSFFTGITNSKLFYFYLLIPCTFFFYQINILNDKIAANISPSKNHVVSVIEVKKLADECNYLKTICTDNKIQLIVISDHWFYDFYDYGCPSCMDSFPNTLRPSYERRTWRLLEDERKIYPTILIIDTKRNFACEFNFVKKVDHTENFYIIENNKLHTMDLLNLIHIEYRKYK